MRVCVLDYICTRVIRFLLYIPVNVLFFIEHLSGLTNGLLRLSSGDTLPFM